MAARPTTHQDPEHPDFDAGPEVEGIPARLDVMEPGPILAAFLSSIDVTTLSGHDQVIVLRAHDRMASHHTAARYRAMAAVHGTMLNLDGYRQPYEEAADSASTEVRAALRLTRRAADNEVAPALTLHHRIPRLAEMLASGAIDVRRTRVIDSATLHPPDARARAVVDEISLEAPELTTGQLRSRIRRISIEVDPDDAAERYTRRVDDRRMVMESTEDGTANLFGLDLPSDTATSISSFIHSVAVSLRGDGETRTMDQLRADVFMDLLQGITPTGCGSSDTPSAGGVEIVCDLDHTVAVADGGPTCDCNLTPLCRHDHCVKHAKGWRYEVGDDDRITWTSPLGHVYTTPPNRAPP